MLKITVGLVARRIVKRVEKEVTCTELGVELSDKPEGNLPFGTKFEFIGAEFDTTDHKYIIGRPEMHIRDALARDMEWIITHQCQLVDRTLLQRVVGRLKFCARFVEFGRYGIISSLHKRPWLGQDISSVMQI